MLMLYNISYSMNQLGKDLLPMFSEKTNLHNCIVEVNQNFSEISETIRMTELLCNLLTSLTPGQQDLKCFPLITIIKNKDYYKSMTGNWAPDSQQIDVYYKNYYALTNFIPTKPSPEVSLAIGKITQFASKMSCENLTISIRPMLNSLPQTETKLEFQAMLESIFPTPINPSIIRIVHAPESQSLSHESNATLRRMPVARTPAQILALQKPAMKTVRSFKTRQVEVGQQIGTLQRITKLFSTPQTSPHSSLSNQS